MAKFLPGQTGNPKGRPRSDTSAGAIRREIAQHRDDILGVVIDAAEGGDIAACKLLLDRICPQLRPVAEFVKVPIARDATRTGIGERIVQSILAGRIPPDIGAQLITALAAQGKIIETDELLRRIEALEKQSHEPEDPH